MKRSGEFFVKFLFTMALMVLTFYISFSSQRNGCATIDAIKRGMDLKSVLSSATSDIIGAGEEEYSYVSLDLSDHPMYSDQSTARYAAAWEALTTDEQREAYTSILNSAKQITENVSPKNGYMTTRAPFGSLDSMEVFTVIEAVLTDWPELFWLDGSYFIGRNMHDGNYVVLNSVLSYDEICTRAAELKAAVSDILLRIPDGLDEYSRELAIHDIIVGETIYDTETADAGVVFSDSSTVYGCLVEKLAVCSGYSRAFSLLCRLSDIESTTVKGLSYDGRGHMWNACRIDDRWYFVDCTWDDPFDGQAVNVVFYDYFNITKEQLTFNHVIAGLFPSISEDTENEDNLYNFPLPDISSSGRGNYEKCALHVDELNDSNARELRERMTEACLSDKYFFIEFADGIDSAKADNWLGRNWGTVKRASDDPSVNGTSLSRIARNDGTLPYCRNVTCIIMTSNTAEEEEAA